ncbi:hypothetical protein Dsin_010026 [Dipteronia sinensis]|uniref:Uncharacterized protein n=1 Tax=Dipteronia sinensis TaxID=43782 RepID=A0AAE0ARM1_9ROSI|nr:hypothetical protein Dsin_010026 [Dipteronia sinensis]
MYAMNIFRLPKGLIFEIHRLCARFWWGSSNDNRKLHWYKWIRLYISKLDGGLGFRDLETFNKALLAKQCWKVYKNPTSLAARVLKDGYFPSCNFLEAEKKSNVSFVWKSLHWGLGLLSSGLRWRVGTCSAIKIYLHKWVHTDYPILYYKNPYQEALKSLHYLHAYYSRAMADLTSSRGDEEESTNGFFELFQSARKSQ